MSGRKRLLPDPLRPSTLARRFWVQKPITGLPVRLLSRHGPKTWRAELQRRAGPIKSYGSIGSLEVQLARSWREIRYAQKLRFKVFYKEMSAVASATTIIRRRDIDGYDRVCDHLLVIDKEPKIESRTGWRRRPRVVGTYRVLRQEVAERTGGFYTQGEFDLAPLIAARRATHSFVELGRSCVLKPYRNKRTLELLWHGLWTYVREHGVDVMVGCASFEGTDPAEHAMALSFLNHQALAPEEWRVKAHKNLYVPMNLLPQEKVDTKAALKALPPLIKGYLRLGAYVGDGAVIDRQFGTVDVCMILPVERIDPRYFAHFGAPDELASRLVPAPKTIM